MTVIASARSLQSSGSEFAMSDLSMLEFVRDLNGQSRNRLTVDELPFDIDSPAPGNAKPSLSTESDLVPSYMLTSPSQLMPTSNSSLFNYRTGGNFRRKLTSIGNTLFSKTSTNGENTEVLSDPETSTNLAHAVDAGEEPPLPLSRKMFVFPGRAGLPILTNENETVEANPKSEHRRWLNIDSSPEALLAPPSSLMPLVISDPFPLKSLDEYREKQKQLRDNNVVPTLPDPSATAAAMDVVAQNGIDQAAIVNDEGSLPAPQIDLSPTEDANAPYNSPTKKLNNTPTRVGGPALTSPLEAPACKDTSGVGKAKTKDRQLKQKKSPEQPARSPPAKSGFGRMRDVVKNATSLTPKPNKVPVQNPKKTQAEKEKARDQEKPNKKVDTAEESPKANSSKMKERKEQKKKRPQVTIADITLATPGSPPPVLPSSEIPQIPNTSLVIEGKMEDRRIVSSSQRPASVTLRSALKKPSRPQSMGGQDSSTNQSRGSVGPKDVDRAAELQFSPFMVSNLAEKSRVATAPQSTKKVRVVSGNKEKSKDESTISEAPQTPGNSFFSQLARLPESLRSGTRNLSPMQRLTTLFGGEDTASQANTGSESAAFLAREPGNTWTEKPTVQSLGEIFSQSYNSSPFDQGGLVGRLGDPFTLAKPHEGKTHKWRQKFRAKFVLSKDGKVTKTKVSVSERDRNFLPQREKKPKGILKTTQQTFPISVRTESGPALAVLNASAVRQSTRRQTAPKKKRVLKKPS